MSRKYSIVFTGTVTAAGTDTDLLYLKPAADTSLRLLGWSMGQSSEVADAQEEGLRISVIYLPVTVTVGSGGAAATPRSPDQRMTVAAACAARVNDTTVATTSGTAVILNEFSWNERGSPWEFWYPDPELAPVAGISTAAIVVRMQTTLADDATFNYTFWIEEF